MKNRMEDNLTTKLSRRQPFKWKMTSNNKWKAAFKKIENGRQPPKKMEDNLKKRKTFKKTT
jgi:hypothetical protein